MTTTDIVERACEAVVAILDTDAGIVALTGRANGNIVAWNALADAALPCLAYQFVNSASGWAIGDTRRLRFDVSCHADGNDAQAVAHALAERVELALTATALLAQGLDACADPDSRPWNRAFQPEDETAGVRGLTQATVEVVLVVTK
jgi:hypothetical protein